MARTYTRNLISKAEIPLDDATTLVVSMDRGGEITISDKPASGRRPRGQQQKVAVVRIRDLWSQATSAEADAKVGNVFDELLKRLPIADFSSDPAKMSYRVKAWLMGELQRLKNNGTDSGE